MEDTEIDEEQSIRKRMKVDKGINVIYLEEEEQSINQGGHAIVEEK